MNAIRQAINRVNWDRGFSRLNIDERVKFFTDCVLNVFFNFANIKVISIMSKVTFLITPEIKRIIPEKANLYRRYAKHDRSISDSKILRDITSRCKSAI